MLIFFLKLSLLNWGFCWLDELVEVKLESKINVLIFVMWFYLGE